MVGKDYPGTWPQFQRWFPDDEACATYLAKLRWPEGFTCPACGGREAWTVAGGRQDVPGLRAQDLGDRRDDLPSLQAASHDLVRGHVAPVRAGERGLRPRPAEGARVRALTRRRGPGCTSCAGPWPAPAGAPRRAWGGGGDGLHLRRGPHPRGQRRGTLRQQRRGRDRRRARPPPGLRPGRDGPHRQHAAQGGHLRVRQGQHRPRHRPLHRRRPAVQRPRQAGRHHPRADGARGRS